MNLCCAVIGAGAMGHGIGEVLARTEQSVWLYDTDPSALERSLLLVQESLVRLVRYGLITEQMALDIPGRLHPTTDLKCAVEKSWFVVEATPEKLELKREIFSELDRMAPKETLFATNSSSFTISQITTEVSSHRRKQIVGSHFFLPAQIVPLVEVSRTNDTKIEVFNRVYKLWERCGKVPVKVQRDVPGYIANRLQRAIVQEALAQVAEGLASAEDIDRAVQFGFGIRYTVRGPFAQRDVAGLDLATQVQVIQEHDPERFLAGRRHLENLAKSGNLGLKTGRGLLDWHGSNPDLVRKDGDDELARVVSLQQHKFRKDK